MRMRVGVAVMMPVVSVMVMVALLNGVRGSMCVSKTVCVSKTMRVSCGSRKRKCFHGFRLGRRLRLHSGLLGRLRLPSPPRCGRQESHGSLVKQP